MKREEDTTNRKEKTSMQVFITVVLIVAVVLTVFALITKPGSVYSDKPEERNPMEGKIVRFIPDETEPRNADGACGHLEVVREAHYRGRLYDRVIKRLLDIVLSGLGIIILSPFYLFLIIAIYIDDPGPVFFTQKRLGKNKKYFKLHKFRSMRMSTPRDVPTHMLGNPEQYITRMGKFVRRFSLDELPQLYDIFIGNMTAVGPRPALWNQDVLTAERDRWGANDVKPGLTGWAQIDGRDELELPVKARRDGVYTRILKKGGMKAFLFDCRCFLGTIFPVFRGDGIVEGGTGELEHLEDEVNV